YITCCRHNLCAWKTRTLSLHDALPILVGSDATALAVSRALRERGFLVVAIRPPTVPDGSARLRITFSAAHELEDVKRLLETFSRSEEHTSELQSRENLVCRLLLEKKKR